MKKDLLDILKETFGYDSFRGHQESVIRTVISGRDTLVLMPTGGGKSLCYQLPALFLDGTAIVISPLISLMKDQVDALVLNGVSAAVINSSLSSKTIADTKNDLAKGKIKLLYIAPERFNENFLREIGTIKVSLIAIDEAHCLSHWGHDFRPDYLNLKIIKSLFPSIPVVALTATADGLTRRDIISVLGMKDPAVYISSFNRPNITYKVQPKQQSFELLLEFLAGTGNDSGIIYCLSRKSTDQIAQKLNQSGIKALPYHAGLTAEQRAKHQELFQKDEIRIIVATIAFGMGIDKPNVRFVVHMDLPKNIESYYQETGRAGRDGEPSVALLYYSYADVLKLRGFVEIEGDPDRSEIMLNKLDQMSAYADSIQCRRKYLLNYFDEDADAYCGNCDICMEDYEKEDATVPAQMALSAIKRLDEQFGMGYVIDFLRGSKSVKIWANHKSLPTYGVGVNYTSNYWRGCIQALIQKGYVLVKEGKFPTLSLGNTAFEILRGHQSFFIRKQSKKQSFDKQEEYASPLVNMDYDKSLFETLKLLRKSIAMEEGVPPYIVLSDVSLKELSMYFPKDEVALRNIHGFGKVKVAKYGKVLLEAIQSHCKEHNIPTPSDLIKHGDDSKPPSLRSIKKRKPAKSVDTYKETKKLIDSGLSPEEIAQNRGLTIATIYNHIANWVFLGELEALDFLTLERLDQIKKVIAKIGTETPLRVIMEALDSTEITYDDIKIALAVIRRESNNLAKSGLIYEKGNFAKDI